MVNSMNAAIAGKADAIAVAIVDPKGFDRPIARALDAGIPVFSYNADVPPGSPNKRLAYIGQDLFLSGEMMGERIVQLVGSGEVAIFIATPGQLNLQPRFDGAMAAIKKSGAPINVEDDRDRPDRQRLAHQDPRLLPRPPGHEGHVRHRRHRHA